MTENLHDICASLQHTLVGMLLSRLEEASDQTGIREIAIAGGVSANTGLRKELQLMAVRKKMERLYPGL